MNLNPYILTLDTNILLEMLEPDIYTDKIYNRFLNAVITKIADIYIPRQVLNEWNKHKDNNQKRFHDQILKPIKDLELIPEKLKGAKLINEEKAKQELKKQSRLYKYTYGLRAKNLDKILNDPFHTEIIERSTVSDKLVIDFALEKTPPFFTPPDKKTGAQQKSETADAVILFSTYDFFKKNDISSRGKYFITNNKKDFSEPNNPSNIHENLNQYISEVDFEFTNNIKDVLNTIIPDNFPLIDYTEPNPELYVTDDFFVSCKNCNEEVHKNVDSFIKGNKYNEYHYWMKCRSCGSEWNTGDSIDDFAN
ncbi:PIN domain-containing protein [Bacillus spizizenii]|uniref:PIN domain-containing protein n=1 Tax=Bacillus spizizenii TaxID=96241 RepID=UPI003981DE88